MSPSKSAKKVGKRCQHSDQRSEREGEAETEVIHKKTAGQTPREICDTSDREVRPQKLFINFQSCYVVEKDEESPREPGESVESYYER